MHISFRKGGVMLRKIIRKLTRNQLSVPSRIMLVNFIFQRFFRIDSDCRFSKNYTTRIIGGSKLQIEDNCALVRKSLAVSGGCYIQASEGVKIGRGTIWSFNVCIVSQGHDLHDFAKIPATEAISIGQNCWIGANVTILPGVQLGDKTIVGANSVVTQSFREGNMIVAGVPAKVIRKI